MLGWLSVRFVVQVVLFVSKDLFQPLNRMCVNGFVITVKGGLPFCLFAVVQCIRPLPCCQGSIALTTPELGLVAWCFWCPGVAADVEHGDALSVLLCCVS